MHHHNTLFRTTKDITGVQSVTSGKIRTKVSTNQCLPVVWSIRPETRVTVYRSPVTISGAQNNNTCIIWCNYIYFLELLKYVSNGMSKICHLTSSPPFLPLVYWICFVMIIVLKKTKTVWNEHVNNVIDALEIDFCHWCFQWFFNVCQK